MSLDNEEWNGFDPDDPITVGKWLGILLGAAAALVILAVGLGATLRFVL